MSREEINMRHITAYHRLFYDLFIQPIIDILNEDYRFYRLNVCIFNEASFA